jgi:DNA polymerase bacteriophage-type
MKPVSKLSQRLVDRALRGWPLTQHQMNILLRACLTASPGNTLIACDYGQVEARALAWAAGDEPALEAFRDPEGDPYARLACRLFSIPPDKFSKKVHAQPRDTAKKAELGCGYGMGAPKFMITAEKGGMVWKDPSLCRGGAVCEDPICGAIEWTKPRGNNPAQPFTHGAHTIVNVWRETHAPIVDFWDELKWAAVEATEGRPAKAGPYEFARVDGSTWCMMPSGRPLVYNGMRVEKTAGSKSKDLSYLDPATGFPKRTYGGSLSENVTQAFCRDLLARALVQAEDAGLCPVLHVHDEIVCDVPKEMGREALDLLELIMSDLPAWAAGFPMKVDGFISERYRK